MNHITILDNFIRSKTPLDPAKHDEVYLKNAEMDRPRFRIVSEEESKKPDEPIIVEGKV